MRVKTSQHNGYSTDRQATRRDVWPRGPNISQADDRPQRHNRIDQLVGELMYAVEVEDPRRRDAIDDASDRNRDQPGQPEGPGGSLAPIQPQHQQQRSDTDDRVGLDSEECEGIQRALDAAVEAARSLYCGAPTQRHSGNHAQEPHREPYTGPSG